MVINRSKHNKYTTGAIYGNLTSGGITTDADGNVTASDGLGYSGGIIYINGGAGGGISLELIDMLTNQDAFSYFNVSDGINTVNVEAKLEKDYINLNIIGDNESVETKVSTEKYLPETYYNSTGLKPGRYSVSYNKILIPDISGGDPVETVKWVITIKKIYGDPIFPSTDFNGVLLLEDGNSLGAFSIDSDRLTVTSNQTTGLLQIVMQLDSLINFTEIRLISSEDYTSSAYTTITDIKDITIQTFTTVLISLAGATRYWKLDENGKLFTEYDVYTTKTLGAKDLIWSDKGYRVGNFVLGISGGIFHVDDEIGTVYAELDKLRVRKKAYFETLEIVNVNTVGGKLIISPAGAITIRKVDINDTYYRCYFLGEQDGVEINNRFKVNDLAFSQNFNIKKPGNYELVANHYFWRKVVGVSTQVDSDGNHYIDLSITDCDTDSDIPHVNDVVAQLGNTTDPDRLSAMIFSSVDSESPRIMLCHGIDTYTLNATNYFDLGVNHATNQAYMNVYGNTFIGAKDGSTYIDYSQTNGLTIKAHISASSTYGGQSFSDVFVTSENLSASVKAIVGDDLEFLLNLIDGNIESYFYDYSPTLNNYPAVEWTTEADKQRHNGDTFTNILEFISDSLTPDAGKSWRWVKNDSGVWGWIPISDSDAVAALKKAGLAQDTADGKRKVFTQKPGLNDDYQVGDLWVNATFTDSGGLLLYSNDLLRANTAKNKGELFSITHWELASKYTDDTMASDALAKANAALAAATAAGSAATLAQTEINAYKIEIDDIFSDGVITTSERSRLNTLKDTINTTLFDVLTTYNNVYNNSALDGKTQKSALQAAYTLFSNSATALLNSVTTVTNKSTISKGDISAVDLAYSNFNTKYTDYVAALHAANLEIMNTLSNTAYANAVNKFAWLNGLFDPDQTTTIEGGVVTTGVLALGKTTSGVFNVNAGINGVSNSSYLGNGIALWFGGDMIDKDNYTAGNRPANVATSLIRFDGSGYLGYVPNSDSSKDDAAIWWDATGNIHANPLSFFVGPESVGLLLSAFQIVPTSVGAPAAQYIIQRAPFQEVRIGNAYLGYDVVNNAVYVYTRDEQGNETACNFYVLGGISMYGSGSGSGGAGGLDVDAMWDILGESGIELIHPSHISTALSTYATQDWVTELLGSITVDTTNLVTINTVLTITSAKTFTNPVKVSITATTPSQEGLHYYNGNTLLGTIGAVHDGTTISYMLLNPKGVLDGFNGLVVGDELGFNGHLVFHSGNTVIPKMPNLRKYVTLDTALTITKLKTMTAGLKVSGRVYSSGDDEGIVIGKASTGYAGITLGEPSGVRSTLYLSPSNNAFWRFNNGTTSFDITHPMKSGTIALTSDFGNYVTLNTVQSLSAIKRLKGGSGIHMSANTSNYETFNFTNVEGTSILGYIGYHNTAGNLFISAKGDNAYAYTDEVGKYQLKLSSAGAFTFNTYPVLHTGNYAGILDSRYVKKSGDTMTGVLHLQADSYNDSYSGALNMNNSNIYGVNSIYTSNVAEKSEEGIHFYRDSTHVDTLWASNGVLRFVPNRTLGSSSTTDGNVIWHAGNDGSGSGLDADLLDGYQGSKYLRSFWTNAPGYDANNTGNDSFVTFTYSNNAPQTGVLADLCTKGYGVQFNTSYYGDTYLYYRRHGPSSDGGIGTWQQLARVTDNVASATKLQTARRIWGQSFDGTGNVDGHLTINNSNLTTVNYGVTSSFGALNSGYCHFQTTASLFHFDKGISVQNNVESYGSGSVGTASKPWDGMYSSNWFRSTGATGWYNETYTGGWYQTDSEQVRIYNNKVLYLDGIRAWGIGGHNVGLKLYSYSHIGINMATNSCTWGLYANIDGKMYIGTRSGNVNDSSGSYIVTITPTGMNLTGNFLATGGITMYSDLRKKNVLGDTSLSLDKICAAPLFRFTYKDDDKSALHIGSSAQYWQDVPGIVGTDSEGKYLTMDYNAMLSAVTLSLAKYTKKHETEIEKLKMENIQLRQRIEFLERRVA